MKDPERRPGAVYAHEAGTEHIGRRVSIRYPSHEPDVHAHVDRVRRWRPGG